MALKITRASDPIIVERLNTVIYGPPGIAKTSLAFTAEARHAYRRALSARSNRGEEDNG